MKTNKINKMETNPYIIAGDLEGMLNRNQRDILDYFMMNGEKETDVYDLITYCLYIINSFDGKKRLLDAQIIAFCNSAFKS